MLDFLAASHKTCPERMPCGAGCGRTSWRCARPAPLGVLCGTASLERAPAGSGRSRDRLKLRPQLLGGVRMAGLERLLARCPHPDAAAISRALIFRGLRRAQALGGTSGKFLFFAPPRPRRAKGAPRSRQAPTPAVRSLRVAHRRGGRLAAPLRKNLKPPIPSDPLI